MACDSCEYARHVPARLLRRRPVLVHMPFVTPLSETLSGRTIEPFEWPASYFVSVIMVLVRHGARDIRDHVFGNWISFEDMHVIVCYVSNWVFWFVVIVRDNRINNFMSWIRYLNITLDFLSQKSLHNQQPKRYLYICAHVVFEILIE